MQIASRLRDTTLGDLLASLHRAGASGVLELIEPHARHAIHLRRGFVQAVESDTAAGRLGDVAARVCGLPRPVVERARLFAQARGLRLGQALVATQAIPPHALPDLLGAQQRERLERLYRVRDADIRFRVARPLPAGASEQQPLGVRDTFHGRPRRRPVSEGPRRNRDGDALAQLGLGGQATDDEIRGAFRRLVFELHPDRTQDCTQPERDARAARLVRVLDAYRTLSRPR